MYIGMHSEHILPGYAIASFLLSAHQQAAQRVLTAGQRN